MSGPQEIGGKGGKKSLNVSLNLVPFIDLMSVCVTFLLMTAVWTQTGRISVDQSVQKPQKQQQTEPPKRLTVLLDKAGYTVKFSDGQPEPIPMVSGKYDTVALKKKLEDLKLPKDQKVVVAPEDTVAYTDMITAMDSCMILGLVNVVVADATSVAGEMM
jgi:biopolymer transport protein ExbD